MQVSHREQVIHEIKMASTFSQNTDETGKKWQENKGSQVSNGKRLYSHRCAALSTQT